MYRLINCCTAIALLMMMGCFGSDDTPDVSHIQLSIDRVDFDDAFLGLESGDNIQSSMAILREQYPALTKIYIENVMQFRHPRDTNDNYLADVSGFVQSDAVHGLKHRIDSVHIDRSAYDRGFQDAFRYLKHYFPSYSTPRVYYMMTEYTTATFIFPESQSRDGLGISLDMFMGRAYPYKKIFPTNPSFSEYITNSFDKPYVVKKGIDAVIDDLVGYPNGPRMIDVMINNGKKQYLLEKLLPATPDSILWEYPAAQMEWVKQNELNLYSHFTSQEMLYSDNQMDYMKFVNPSPNSPGLPSEAPGRTANYIGYKIIEAYMEKTGSSLEDLIEKKNSQEILNQARYRPRI